MSTLFISDLHLSPDRPAQIALFAEFLTGITAGVEALYILGDLVEIWVGDDDDSGAHPDLISALQRCTKSGTAVYVMRGNRDFLLGAAFAAQTGCRLIDDPAVIDLNGIRTLLMHGDSLCTEDAAYQTYRTRVRDPRHQRCFQRLPLTLRRLIGRLLRWLSLRAARRKRSGVMDVSDSAVINALREHDASLLIHGHTHRPAVHKVSVDGKPATRIVLGDWYVQDSVLVCDAAGHQLLRVRDWLAHPVQGNA